MKPVKNFGVVLDSNDTDWLAGAIPYEERNPSGDWTAYAPPGEIQYSNMADSMGCVSFSFLNCLETQLKFFGETADFSDRFLAKMSGTTIHGNTLVKVADTYRASGCVVESDWPKPQNFTWDTFYAEVPDDVKAKAVKHSISYEWVETSVSSLQYHLKHAPLQLVVPGHAIMGIYSNADIFRYFDTYQPYIKDKSHPPLYALKIVLNNKPNMLDKDDVKFLQALEGFSDQGGVDYWGDGTHTLKQYKAARVPDKINELSKL